MEAQHHDQVGGVKSLAERLRSGQIQIKKVTRK